ncbi:ATP-binding protein [Gilvibacter sediminis]|uniref:PAS domain-containing sensor histidine kinase n=1 Tax=Gilvibacter sediminis TaxID=379071 RepID=UPI002350722D|nr:ATP-binding protein [Gilvibacter sediminis]MDC7997292.1 ATP-binding protein [Gilvibacter sediminis]
MDSKEHTLLLRKIEREKSARKQAEKILEVKAAELYQRTQQLHEANQQLETLLGEKNSQLQGIFENIVDAYVVMDLAGNILRMNEAANKLFGIDLEKETVNVASLIYPEDVAYAMASFQSLNEKGYFTNYQARVLTRSQGVRWVQINASIVLDNKERPIAAQGIVRDITDELNESNALAFISEVAQEILGKTNFREIGTILAQKVSAFLKTEDCVVYLKMPEQKYLQQISAVGAKLDKDGNIVNPLIIPVGTGIVGSVAQSGKAELIGNTRADKRYIRDDAARLSELAVAISVDDQVLGVIDAEHPQADFFTKEQLKTLTSVSNLVALQLRSAMDVSARRESEARNAKLLDQLELSNRELSEYAHMVSHDLKSPLRSISALAEWIKEDNYDQLPDESKEHFALLEGTITKMEELISNVLEYASVDRVAEEFAPVDTRELVQEIEDLIFVPEHIELQIADNLPVVSGNRIMLQQLFQNLIVNAVKYNDKPSGFVKIDCVDKDTFFEFTVADNGMGIAPEYHDKIFKIFQSLNPDGESSGLGLALVKKVVEVHHGEIWLDSTIDQGSTFYFTLSKKK